MSESHLPLPPDALAHRVGGTKGEAFEKQGREIRDTIVRGLPENYDFTGKRVLDFGCGSGRVLRHFVHEAGQGEFWGCDIDRNSIAWLRDNFPPHFHWFTNPVEPHLPIQTDFFDLVYVISVFTHLTDEQWEPWLLELRRVLKPNGTALITFHNRVAYEYNTHQHFDEKKTGMLVLHPNQAWEAGGPMVYHSNWWIQENWGRHFSIDYISREGLSNWQSIAAMTKTDAPNLTANRNCPLLQPYLYQFQNADFRGMLNPTPRRSNWLRQWHGMEVTCDENDAVVIGGWLASRGGKISRIQFVLDEKEIATIPGTDHDRKDVHISYPDWPDSLHSGFEATLDLSGWAIGEHHLCVRAADNVGNHLQIETPLILLSK